MESVGFGFFIGFLLRLHLDLYKMKRLPKVILGLFLVRLELVRLSNSFCFFEKCLHANIQATTDKTNPPMARQTQIHHE